MLHNIDSITASAKTTLQNRAFTLRENPKYREQTERVTVRVGDLISSNFFGIQTENKTRVKSPSSTKNKVTKNAIKFAQKQVSSEELLDINEFSLFDIYGGKIVVLDVSDNFYSNHLCIDGFLKKRKKSRKLLNEAKSKASLSDDKLEISLLSQKLYNEIDTTCQRYVAAAICKFIINSEELKEEFGIYNIPSRFKNHNLPNEYIAQHITLGSTKLPGWYMEFQFKSLTDYDIARTGEASHLAREGKKLVIPNSLSEVDFDTIPEYMVYVPDTTLYIPSQMECLFHYLSPAFYQKKLASENPEKLMELFKEFPEKSSGSFKKF